MTSQLLRYRSIRVPVDHLLFPTAKRPGLSADGVTAYLPEHRVILFEKIGFGPHLCHWNSRHIVNWGGIKGHRLVVDHVNNNGRDNDPENLVPSCTSCNARRANEPLVLPATVGNGKKGIYNGRAVLTPDNIREIREGCSGGQLQVFYVNKFGVSKGQISRIVRRDQWADLEDVAA